MGKADAQATRQHVARGSEPWVRLRPKTCIEWMSQPGQCHDQLRPRQNREGRLVLPHNTSGSGLVYLTFRVGPSSGADDAAFVLWPTSPWPVHVIAMKDEAVGMPAS